MATDQTTIDYLLEQLLQRVDARAGKMFGEYAVYVDDKVVGFVCDDMLFVKITPGTSEIVREDTELGKPYPKAKDYWVIDEAHWTDVDYLADLVTRCAADLPRPKPKTPRAAKRPS